MLRALIGIKAEAQLLNTSQSLKFRGVNQTHHQLAFVSIGAKADDVVNRIAIDALSQIVKLPGRVLTKFSMA